jgi:carbamoyl-phosphate synthase small subunit
MVQMNAVICTDGTSIEDLKKELANVPNMEGLELASKVSTTEPYFFEMKMLLIKFRL